MENQEFQGKSVVVTGAAAGMGKAITEGFIRKGALVIGVDINDEALRELARRLTEAYGQEAGGRLIPYAADISRQETNEAMIQKAVEAAGRIDILVNNAGIAGHSETIADTTNEDWNRILNVDLNGPMFAFRAAVRQMRKQGGGNIISIASVAGLKGCRASVAYEVAKHGVVALSEHTAYSYMHEGIRSNVICPGAIRTGITRSTQTPHQWCRKRSNGMRQVRASETSSNR